MGTRGLVYRFQWQVGTHAAIPRTVPGRRYMPKGRELERKGEGSREGGKKRGRQAGLLL